MKTAHFPGSLRFKLPILTCPLKNHSIDRAMKYCWFSSSSELFLGTMIGSGFEIKRFGLLNYKVFILFNCALIPRIQVAF